MNEITGLSNVLVAEDDESLNRLIQKTLQKAGFHTEPAFNGSDTIEKLTANPNIILLLDYLLPDINGKEVIKVLLKHRCKVPFMVMTGHGDEEIAVEMMKLGARDYIVKDLGFLDVLPSIVKRIHDDWDKEKRLSKTEETLRENENKWLSLVKNTPDFITIVDSNGTIQFINRVMPDLKREEMMGSSMYNFQPPESKDLHKKLLEQVFKTGEPGIIEAAGTGPDGNTAWYETRIVPVKDDIRVVAAILIASDITGRIKSEKELKSSREQLRNLAAHLQNAREQERTSVAREIHDELGQILTALKIDLSWVNKRLRKDQDTLLGKTESMDRIIDSTIKTVKRISTELRPGILDNLGLVAAIEWQADEFRKRTGIKCKVRADFAEKALKQNYSTGIFRICQEALTNVSRHANATEVNVDLKDRDGEIELEICDNGKGIKKEQRSNNKSFGLIGIKERAHFLGGRAEFKGAPGKGTRLTVKIPFPKQGAKR
jgi:two-component system sensor histidine kinase UhpB